MTQYQIQVLRYETEKKPSLTYSEEGASLVLLVSPFADLVDLPIQHEVKGYDAGHYME